MTWHRLADRIMRLAVAIAPPGKASWGQAMRAELAVIEDGPAALNWAGGCLVAATGWALRRDGPYLLLVSAGALCQPILGMGVVAATQRLGFDFYTAANFSIPLTFGVPALIIAAWRPDRAIATALLIPAATGWPFILAFIARSIELSGPVSWTALLVLSLLWPSVIGAAVGWMIRRRGWI